MEYIASALQYNTCLQTLELGSNSLGADGCILLARALVRSAVTEVIIPRNHVGDVGIAAVAELIRLSQNITSLDLSSNNITLKGAKQLSDGLRASPSITSLNVCLYFSFYVSLQCSL
jgi:Ran GTPase-activating protein (RanGAP) involved in mRNA processing and transport